ncbi:HD domain-containing protein [Patescibacteria group bacterium]|nr:HD domain-containing protein [Patescibacteria group bacterium]MBU4367559.1 HD domain-containing protein [Patescibacteria group bacterium]MBU4461600.1 HD domain-containing protein [Patescibacteria group bacterium]MCG2699497.1 HD domain-containing protein [Candidatus Parcubacteria bacterium]
MVIPKEVKSVVEKLKKSGFEAYIVGGCVRDFLISVEPKDWDITTNAKPGEIQKIFPKSFYENKFLTVTVKTNSKKEKLQEIEITTYRLETKYTDKRHPDEISFAKTLQDDLARRDFTINAIALEPQKTKNKIIDLYSGQEDLKNRIIRTVGNPEERFSEDALRMMRAVRFATTLGFKIEEKTANAIKKNAAQLEAISKERIRDEFLKIVMSERADEGIELLRELGLLKFIVPELEEGYKISQNKHHIYDCWQHSVFSLKYAAQKRFNQNVKLAALFHDIGKPRVKRGEGLDATFYNHEIVGAKITKEILERLKFSKKDIEKIVKLVRYHLFYYNAGEVKDSSVRRLVRNVGPESMEELLQVRMADRIGSGVPKAEPYKLRHLKYVVDKVSQDPISAQMLKTNGNEIMKLLDIKPGPKIGQILDILLGEVLTDPKKNKKELLKKEVEKLGKLSDNELEKLSDSAKKEREKIETKKDEMTKQKYWVT